MIDYNILSVIITAFSEFAKSELFENFALFFVGIYSSSPSFFFLPNEFLIVPAYVFGVNPVLLVIAVGIGGFFGDSVLYFLGHYFHRKIKGSTKTRVNHWLYRYKHLVYVASPNLFFGIGDIILILSGIRHIPFRSIAPFLLLGNFVRGIWGMILVIYGIQLFDWLV